MKAKLKMDKKAIREFFVQHVEKIVFAAVVVCFALIVYRATAREMFPTTPDNQPVTPDKLAGYAGDAKEWWEKTVPDPLDCPTGDYPAIAARSRIPIELADYDTERPWDFPPIGQRTKRGEPPLDPVEGLRGTADCGRISMLAEVEDAAASLPPGGSGATPRTLPNVRSVPVERGQRWVVLTGLVPYGKQIERFQDYFKTAQQRNPQTDFPAYRGYIVQRAEVSSADPNAPLNWSETFYSGTARKEATNEWASRAQMISEVVDPIFLDTDGVNKGPVLSFPLPPLVDREWDESVVHKPDIPFFRREYGMLNPEEEVGPEGAAPEDPFASGDSNRPFYDRRSAVYTPPSRGYEGPMTGSYLLGQANRAPKHLLFRFFDFNVEAGKRYRYRVRLVLWNPNLTVEDRYLTDEVLAKKTQIEEQAEKECSAGNTRAAGAILWKWKLVESDWTEPSDVISVPRNSRLLALSVRPPRAGADRSGDVMVISWVEDRGIEAFSEQSVGRGKVANFRGRRFPETKQPRKSSKSPLEEVQMYAPPEGLETGLDEPPPVDYLTDTLVLDMHGGETIRGKDRLKRPGAILLLDPDGALVVRHELDDLTECTELQQRTLTVEQPGAQYYDDYERGYGEGSDLDALRGRGSGYDTPGMWPRRGGRGGYDVMGPRRGGRGGYDGPMNQGPGRPPRS